MIWWQSYYKPVSFGNSYSSNYIKKEGNGDRSKSLSIEEYLNKTRPYLKDVFKNLTKSDTWKFQLAIAINFMLTRDIDEECLMHSKNDSAEFTTNDKADKVIEKTEKLFC